MIVLNHVTSRYHVSVLSSYVLLSVNLHLTVSYNISLYRDIQAAIYRYTQIVYRYISNVHTCICALPHMYVRS